LEKVKEKMESDFKEGAENGYSIEDQMKIVRLVCFTLTNRTDGKLRLGEHAMK